MSKVKCYSVRLQSLFSISEKAYKATGFDGSEAIIPKSQVFGQDYDVQKSEAYWISAWILGQKSLQYSSKKESFFDKERADFVKEDGVTVERHVPEPVEPVDVEVVAELVREVKGYSLRWEMVKIPINRFGKLVVRNRQVIYTFTGPSNATPKSFVELSDAAYEVARRKEGHTIEPYTTPDFEATVIKEKEAEESRAAQAIVDTEADLIRQQAETQAAAVVKANIDELLSTGMDMLSAWKTAGCPHPAPAEVCEAKKASGLNWKLFAQSIQTGATA